MQTEDKKLECYMHEGINKAGKPYVSVTIKLTPNSEKVVFLTSVEQEVVKLYNTKK